MAEYIYSKNIQTIINCGHIQEATKLEVITIGLGLIKNLNDFPGYIWHDSEGNIVVATKENPEGIVYDQDRTLVVRILGGEVISKDGMYDIYAPSNEKLPKLLRNRIGINKLSMREFDELYPLFKVSSEVTPALAPSEERLVIVITKNMLAGEKYLTCELPITWSNGVPSYTKLYEGDIFVVENVETGKGYRIGKEEFELTHKLV